MNRIALALAATPLLFLAACAETTGTTDGGSSEAPAKDDKPKYTSEQQAAIDAAENYVDMMPFSRKGLIDQLSAKTGDGFPKKDAVFAVNHIKVDWNAEAVEAVEMYKDTMPMSKQGMIDQLTSPAGDKFTPEQAKYAVNKAY